jgi:hypothetical protein
MLDFAGGRGRRRRYSCVGRWCNRLARPPRCRKSRLRARRRGVPGRPQCRSWADRRGPSPRPRQEERRAPERDSGEVFSELFSMVWRFSAEVMASRTLKRRRIPSCRLSPTATAPLCGSTPMRFRIRKSPAKGFSRNSSISTPTNSAVLARCRSRRLREANSYRKTSKVGLPSSS